MRLQFAIDKKYDVEMVKEMGFSKKIISYVDVQYKTSFKYLKLTKELYQKSWDEINNEFSKYVEKRTGYKWHYPKYFCVVSVIHRGISNWGDAPKIVRGWQENPYFMRRITAHELILSHYFEIYKRNYKEEGLTDGQVWALAEISAFALTSLTKEVKKWWPWNTEYYTNHNYPHIVNLQNKLKSIFTKSKNFDDYIKQGIKLVKKYPEMWPTQKSNS
jgi:hypothetical protein